MSRVKALLCSALVAALLLGCAPATAGRGDVGASRVDVVNGTTSPSGVTAPSLATVSSPGPTPTPAARRVSLAAAGLAEASGIAALPDGTFAIVDDDRDVVTIVDTTGAVRRTIALPGFSPRNIEAIAYRPCPQGQCLYVGDIGGPRRRIGIAVLFQEQMVGTWSYRYPDGAYDAETLLVDEFGLMIITKPSMKQAKDAVPHRIYRGRPGGGDLEFVGSFQPITPAKPTVSVFVGNLVTDAYYDGQRLLLLSYDNVVEYNPPRAGADLSTFTTWPHRTLGLPVLPQAEGITGELDGCGYAVVSETGPLNLGPVLLRQPCAAATG